MMVFKVTSRALILTAILVVGLLSLGGEPILVAAETDWGGTVQTYLEGGNQSDNELASGASAGLWLESRLNDDTRFSLSGGYAFNYDNDEIFQYPVLNLAAVSIRQDRYYVRIGRFTMSDANQLLFKALADGFDLKWADENNSILFGIGFTGFAFNRSSQVIMTAVDQRDYDNADPFSLASPRIALFSEYARVFQSDSKGSSPKDHTLTVGFLVEIDGRRELDVIADNVSSSILHSAFLQVGARGLLTKTLLYKVNLVGQTANNEIPGEARSLPLIGGLAEALITWVPGGKLSPSLSGEILYSTGDKWSQRPDWEGTFYGTGDSLHQYTPLTTRTAGYVLAPRVGNLMYVRVGASIRPVEVFSLALDNYLLLRSVDGPVYGISMQASDGDSLLLGNEVVLSANLRPFSDFGVNAKAGVFIPNESLLEEGMVYRMGATVSLSY